MSAEQLELPQTAIRLMAPDVGGGFGYKGKHYPEETIIAWAARRLRRPVQMGRPAEAKASSPTIRAAII